MSVIAFAPHRAFDPEAVDVLASAFEKDSWSATSLAATQQTLIGRAIRLPPLAIGERTTVYFQVDASAAHRGKPDVEFVLLNLGGTPDPTNPMRHNSRAIFIAEINYDPTTGTVTGLVPEGRLTLKLQAAAIDAQALTRLCRRMAIPSSPSRQALLHSGNGGTSPIQDVLAALGLKLR